MLQSSRENKFHIIYSIIFSPKIVPFMR